MRASNLFHRFGTLGLVSLALAGLSSCGGGGGKASNSPSAQPATPQLSSITVTPAAASVPLGKTQQFAAMGTFSDGSSKDLSSSVSWSSSASSIATISATGLATGKGQGVSTITASSGAVVGSTGFTVAAAALQTIAVSPQTGTVAAGLTQQFTATGTFSDRSMKQLTTGVTWSSSDLTLATVDNNGLATTLKQGSVMISAVSASIAGQTSFSIGPPQPVGLAISPAAASVVIGSGNPTKLSALLSFTDKSVLDVSSQSKWTSANPFNAMVDATGNVTTAHRGYSRITAVNGSFSAGADFAVIAVPRFLHYAFDQAREVARATVDANTGRLRMEGYIRAANPALQVTTIVHCDTTDPGEKFLYDAGTVPAGNNTLTGQIQIFSIDNVGGALVPLANSPFAQASPLSCIDFEPTGKFAFASSNILTPSTTKLLIFSQDSATGLLTLLNSMDVGGTPARVAIDPFDKYIYTTILSNGGQTVAAAGYTLDPISESLTPIPAASFLLANDAGSFTFHPSGNFVFLPRGASIDTYSVDRTTGNLHLSSSTPTCENATPIRFSPDARFAYIGCSQDASRNPNSSSVESFAVGTNGALTHLGSASSPDFPNGLDMDPSGQFLYVINIGSYIDSYQIGQDGVAKLIQRIGAQFDRSTGMAFVGGDSAIQYSPRFAYISSIGDNKISTYAVQPDGTLLSTSSIAPAQLQPFSLSLPPYGNDLMVASVASNPNLTAYPLDPNTGAIGSGFNFGSMVNNATTGAVTIDSSGLFAFETDSANGKIYPFSKFQTFWSLTTFIDSNNNPLPPVSTGANPGPVIVDPSGILVYVGNQGDDTISAYVYFGSAPELNESTSAVTSPFTDGSPFSIGAKPLAFAIDPDGAFLYVICGDQTLRVFSIAYASRGHIAQVSSTQLGAMPVGLAADSTGRFVYVASGTGVSAFAVNAQTGALTAVTLSPAINLSNVNGVYVEPSGRFLYLTTSTPPAPPNPGSGAVFAYSINSDGTLAALSTNPVATPNQPSSMVFSARIQ